MCGLFDLATLCDADGRLILHWDSDDPEREIKSLSEELLSRFELIVEPHGIHLLEKFSPLAKFSPSPNRD